MANARNHSTYRWPACPAPRTAASLREPSQGPLSSPKPRPRSCLPAHGGGGAAPAGPPEPGEPWGGAGAIQGPTGPSCLPDPWAQGFAGTSPHPPPLPAPSRPPGPPPRTPDAHLTAGRSGTRSAPPRPAASRTGLPAAPRVSGRGWVLPGAGRPGATPPAGEAGPAHRSGKVEPRGEGPVGIAVPRRRSREPSGHVEPGDASGTPEAWKRGPRRARNLKTGNLGNFGCQTYNIASQWQPPGLCLGYAPAWTSLPIELTIIPVSPQRRFF